MKLYSFQKDQIHFINSVLKYSNICGVESPTGSGKTITFLQYAVDYLNEHPNDNVIISTGFNNLVFQIEDTLRNVFDIDPIVLIGKALTNCPDIMNEKGLEYRQFTRNRYYCGNPDCKGIYSKSNYNLQRATHNTGNIILCNHSILISMEPMLEKVANLIVIDEAHTMLDYYNMYNQVEMGNSELKVVNDGLRKLNISSPLFYNIIMNNLKNGKQIGNKQINKFKELYSDLDLSKAKNRAIEDIVDGFTTYCTSPYEIGYYHEIKFYEDSNLIKTLNFSKFTKTIDIYNNNKKILFSATLDKLTRFVFQINKNDIYIEKKFSFDYSKSYFYQYYGNWENNFEDFISRIQENEDNHNGIFLFTSFDSMNKFKTMFRGKIPYVITDNFYEFNKIRNNHNVIFVGSRKYFQGIDLDHIDFVCLNTIPFDPYGNKSKAEQAFFEQDKRFNAWIQYVVPKVENTIIQATGRLWRKYGNNGSIAIFDDRSDKFDRIISDSIIKVRKGINVIKID